MSARQYTAVARPNGDPRLGLTAPHILLIEHSGTVIRRELVFSEGEAEAASTALASALADLAGARRYPTAYLGPYPIRAHRTIAEVEEASA
jgi:streptomycin 6-kinase